MLAICRIDHVFSGDLQIAAKNNSKLALALACFTPHNPLAVHLGQWEKPSFAPS
jgi:hypothetical protein